MSYNEQRRYTSRDVLDRVTETARVTSKYGVPSCTLSFPIGMATSPDDIKRIRVDGVHFLDQTPEGSPIITLAFAPLKGRSGEEVNAWVEEKKSKKEKGSGRKKGR